MRVCTSCRRLLRGDARQCPDDGAAPEDVETLPKGTRLGGYKIERVLGEGGMGFVYEATHETLNRRTAIKMLRPELAKIEQIVTRFLNEAKAVNVIDHQNIVNVYDYGDGVEGSVYFVMEFLEGEALDDLMHRRRPLPLPLVLHLFGQIAKALAAAHAKRIVHRDLKPGNVFITARQDNPFFVKLLDFGIAQLRGEGAVQGLTLAGTVMGTPQYMSPEQVTGGTVDARSDVWALGVMMYRAATGQAPFKGEEFVELADKILHHPPAPPGQLLPLPASLSALIMSCLERNLEARCPSIDAVLAGLERVKQELRLDDPAILAAVRAESGAAVVGLPGPAGDRTRGSLAGSMPQYQGVSADALRMAASGAAPRPRQSRLGLYVTLGALAGGIASAGVVLFGSGDEPKPSPPKVEGSGAGSAGSATVTTPEGPDGPQKVVPGKRTIADADAGRNMDEVRKIAADTLRAELESGDPKRRGVAVDALALARVPAGAPLLHLALKSTDVSVKAARALGELALPDSAPKVREALGQSGGRLGVELAAALDRLGDRSGRPILKRALGDPGTRLPAALALADAGDKAARPVLGEILEATPEGRDQWRAAAGGLLKLGEGSARKLLEGELAQPDAARAVGAAELLARAGDARSREQLARNMKDPDFARPGNAALALARLGDKRALEWVGQGLASADLEERRLALGVCGALAADATRHRGEIVKLTTDPDLGVRMTAVAVLLGM